MTITTDFSNAAVPIGRKFAAYLGDCINTWLAAWLAHQERAAARKVLLSFSDRQLHDIGLFRSQIEDALNHPPRRG